MFKRALILIGATLLALSACNNVERDSIFRSKVGDDNYTFEMKQFTAKKMVITTVEYKNEKEFAEAYETKTKQSYKRENNRVIAAWTEYVYKNDVNTCTIHIMDPFYSYEPDFMGHELAHCMYGQFHPSQK